MNYKTELFETFILMYNSIVCPFLHEQLVDKFKDYFLKAYLFIWWFNGRRFSQSLVFVG